MVVQVSDSLGPCTRMTKLSWHQDSIWPTSYDEPFSSEEAEKSRPWECPSFELIGFAADFVYFDAL